MVNLALIATAAFLGIIYLLIYREKDFIISEIRSFNPETEYFSLKDGNQSALIIGLDIPHEWFNDTKMKYPWSGFIEYDNRLLEYMYKLFDETTQDCGFPVDSDLWRALNKSQKVFWSFLVFNGEMDDGGMHNFLFRKPEFMFCVDEMFSEIGCDQLQKDYKNVIQELAGSQASMKEIMLSFNEEGESYEQRWNAYAQGQFDLQSSRIIERYYYAPAFKKRIYKKMSNYIEANLDSFAAII